AVMASSGVLVREIYPGSPAAMAGLQSGDLITRVDERSIASYLEWAQVLFNLKVDEPRTFEIQRRKETLTLSVVPKSRSFGAFYDTPDPLALALRRIGQLVMLGLACFVAFARPRDWSAVIAALFFAGLSALPEDPNGIYAMLRQLPNVLFA